MKSHLFLLSLLWSFTAAVNAETLIPAGWDPALAGDQVIRRLFMNLNGKVRVEVLDSAGQVLASSRATVGDDTKRRVGWEGHDNLSKFAGQPVRFRFHQKKGSLYAFWVTPDPDGASRGYLAGGSPDHSGLVEDGTSADK